MDSILLELWQALKAFTAAQWVVSAAIGILLGTSLFFLFRWIYGARAEAQSTLLDLKDKTIEHYKTEHSNRSDLRKLSDVLPDDWKPFLDQPYDQLEEALQDALAQQKMNYSSSNMGFVQDAQLYILYLEHVHSLPANEAIAAKLEQQAWLHHRRKFCESAVESHGGSLAPLEYNMAFIKKTQERIDEFKLRRSAA